MDLGYYLQLKMHATLVLTIHMKRFESCNTPQHNVMPCHLWIQCSSGARARIEIFISAFCETFLCVLCLHYPQDESVSGTPRARGDIALPSLLSVLCFLVIFLVFSCAWYSGRKWLLEEKVLKTDKHTQAVLHTRVAQGQTHLTPYRLKKLIHD